MLTHMHGGQEESSTRIAARRPRKCEVCVELRGQHATCFTHLLQSGYVWDGPYAGLEHVLCVHVCDHVFVCV